MTKTSTRAHDRNCLRELARQYEEIAAHPVQEERRALWRRQNSLKPARPLIYVRAFAWRELPESRCRGEDPFCRVYEEQFRRMLYWYSLEDDSIFEPWLTVEAAHRTPPDALFGLHTRWVEGDDPRGSKVMDPPIRDPEDAARMVAPHHETDEEETARRADRLHDLVGDLIPIHVERAPLFRTWNGDISTQLALLRGLEQIMVDALERPEWLHKLLGFLRDCVLRAHEEGEAAGDWTLSAHENQAMPYAEELDDPAIDGRPVARDKLWYFCASQETTLFGPAQFEEFMLQYQLDILKPFGLVAYGCCEDLTQKIDVLRQIPNLRRIAVAPAANVPCCAEQIGRDYVISYRPSPSDMVGYDFDEDRIRRILKDDLSACRDGHVDITLKDVETVQGDPARVRRWVAITREVIDEVWSRSVRRP
jgi:hypothetical protein